MDKYEIESAITSISKAIEDLSYRLYTLEDSMAEINAYIEEQKGEFADA